MHSPTVTKKEFLQSCLIALFGLAGAISSGWVFKEFLERTASDDKWVRFGSLSLLPLHHLNVICFCVIMGAVVARHFWKRKAHSHSQSPHSPSVLRITQVSVLTLVLTLWAVILIFMEIHFPFIRLYLAKLLGVEDMFFNTAVGLAERWFA